MVKLKIVILKLLFGRR